MYSVVRDLGTGRRGAFVVKSMGGGHELAMKRYDLNLTDHKLAADMGVSFFCLTF